jgi:hypothetical protein
MNRMVELPSHYLGLILIGNEEMKRINGSEIYNL